MSGMVMSITVDLEKGDTILTGKFKNKKVIVKDFGTDKNGQPTVNGKPLLHFRIQKLMKDKKKKKSHIAQIQQEFIKAATAKPWDYFSLEEQRKYLRAHPKSKRMITAKPETFTFDYEAPDDAEIAKRHHSDAMSGQFSVLHSRPTSRGQKMEIERQKQMYRDRLSKLHKKHPELYEQWAKEIGSD